MQVREQEARIAAQLRQQFRVDQQQAVAVRQRDQAVRGKKNRGAGKREAHGSVFAVQAVWQQEHEQEKNSLVDRYKSCIASFGEAHQAAARLQVSLKRKEKKKMKNKRLVEGEPH